MVHQLWETAKESITAYTGLPPATFFTALAVGLALCNMVLNLFCYSDEGQAHHGGEFEETMQPLPPPGQLGEITEEELKQYDGSDPEKPLLMAIKGQIYDVSRSKMFYGPGGPYALFAGKDVRRAPARMSFKEKDLNGKLTGLGVFELEALQDWEHRFMSKYVKVGTDKTTVRASNGAPEREAREAVKVGTVKTTKQASNDAPEREAREVVKVGMVKTTMQASDGAHEMKAREAAEADVAEPAEATNADVAKLEEDDQWEGAAYEAEEPLLMLRKRSARREVRKAVKVGTVKTTVQASDGAPEMEAREAAETHVAKSAEHDQWEGAAYEAKEPLLMLRKRSAKREARKAVKVGTVKITAQASDGAPKREAREAAGTDAAKPAEAANGDVAKLAEDDLWEGAAKEAEELLLMLRRRSDFLT